MTRFPRPILLAITLVVSAFTATGVDAAPIESTTLDSFGVLAGSTVTNAGGLGTDIFGNVGVSPGSAITGFITPACTVSGAGVVEAP